jgi:hypothetical protein
MYNCQYKITQNYKNPNWGYAVYYISSCPLKSVNTLPRVHVGHHFGIRCQVSSDIDCIFCFEIINSIDMSQFSAGNCGE